MLRRLRQPELPRANRLVSRQVNPQARRLHILATSQQFNQVVLLQHSQRSDPQVNHQPSPQFIRLTFPPVDRVRNLPDNHLPLLRLSQVVSLLPNLLEVRRHNLRINQVVSPLVIPVLSRRDCLLPSHHRYQLHGHPEPQLANLLDLQPPSHLVFHPDSLRVNHQVNLPVFRFHRPPTSQAVNRALFPLVSPLRDPVPYPLINRLHILQPARLLNRPRSLQLNPRLVHPVCQVAFRRATPVAYHLPNQPESHLVNLLRSHHANQPASRPPNLLHDRQVCLVPNHQLILQINQLVNHLHFLPANHLDNQRQPLLIGRVTYPLHHRVSSRRRFQRDNLPILLPANQLESPRHPQRLLPLFNRVGFLLHSLP